MAMIFISHSRKDNTWAGNLKAWLEAKNHRSLFLDFDREAGIRAGDLWEQELYKKLRQCKVVLALVSHSWLESRWCFAEAVQAREKGKRLILGRIDAAADISGLFRDAQHLDFTRDQADAFTRLEIALADVFDIRPGREPYPGLVPFDEADAGVFVGRDPEIAALLETLESMRLKSRADVERLLLLLGASGSGKSSPRARRRPAPPTSVAGALAAAAADATWARPRARADPRPGGGPAAGHGGGRRPAHGPRSERQRTASMS